MTVDSDSDGIPDCNNDLVEDGGPVTISLQNVTGTPVITERYQRKYDAILAECIEIIENNANTARSDE